MKIMLCGCGCSGLRRKHLVYTKVNNQNAWRCPNHRRLKKGACQKVIIVCVDCGKSCITSLKGSIRKDRCPACLKVRKKQYTDDYNKKISEQRRETNELGYGNSIWHKGAQA